MGGHLNIDGGTRPPRPPDNLSTDCRPLEGGHGENISNAFLLRTYWDSQVFCNLIPYIQFNKVSFDRRNVRAHLLSGIRCEKDKMH